MSFNLSAVQNQLCRRGLDGWLFYDFHHRDPIAYRLLGLEPGLVTRRWYYFIPAQGSPQKLVHRIEAARLDPLPGSKRNYTSWEEQRAGLNEILGPARKIAMQYSPLNAIPYVSLVDAGTVELVRSLGREVVTSADLVQLFEACWSPEQFEMHRAAGQRVDTIMQRAFGRIREFVAAGKSLSEYELQQWILRQFESEGLMTDDPPIVAVNESSGNPHYEPRPDRARPIRRGDWVLLDIWAKLKTPDAVYYDITWVGSAGAELSVRQQEIFAIVKEARNQAIAFVAQARRRGQPIYGYQVDDVARGLIRARGYGDSFLHRTGHSLGTEIHSTGANMDNLETRDAREVVARTCFSIEPGIYLPEFGVRLEVNVYADERDAWVTGRIQDEIVRILE
ncbi:MAG: M24 family metallopeptidase [Terriglobia bacterium]